MIFVIDDDQLMAECIARATGEECQIFSNGIEAVSALDSGVPDLIFLDILLDGPDGFSFLNEISSYADTKKIPVVIVSSLEIKASLADYGVVRVLDKSTMTPEDIKDSVRKYA